MKTEDIGTFQPLPLEQRRGFEFKVKCRDRKQRTVIAFETCSEYLVVHESMEIDGWTVTHTITGYSMAQGLPSYEAARYAAGAMSQVFHLYEDRAAYFEQRLYELPPSLWSWFLMWRLGR